MSSRWLGLTGALGIAACGAEVPAYVAYDNTAVLTSALAPNATLITLGQDVSSPQSVSSSHDLQGSAKVAPLADGFVAVLAASREEVVWDDGARTLGLVRAGSQGVQTLAVDAARSQLVGLGDEAVLLTCDGAGQDTAYLSDALTGFIELQATVTTCVPHVTGRAASADEGLVLVDGGVSRWQVDRAARTLSEVPFTPEPVDLPGVSTVRFLDEPAAGELALVVLDTGVLTYRRGAVSEVAAGIDGLDSVQAHRGADGALRIVTSSGLWRWDADNSGAPEKLADMPAAPGDLAWQPFGAPGGAYAWVAEPNPLNPSELYPTSAQVRLAGDDDFSIVTPSPTPCCDPDACRQAAESYVIGAFGEGPARTVFYDLWTWVGQNQHAMVIAGEGLDCGP